MKKRKNLSDADIYLPPKLVPVFAPERGAVRYRGAHGGRGSGKSFNFAKMAAVFGYAEPLRILCIREFQNSIKESFHSELKTAIESHDWLRRNYKVGVDFLKGKNGTEFIFKGLRNNTATIKSLSQIDICIIEEAENISEAGYQVLEPTIRAPRSEIWTIWNPEKENSATDKRFIKTLPPRSVIAEMNYWDNPWFPKELEEQRRHAQQILDPNTYAHIWGGAYLKHSKAQIFSNKVHVEEFGTPENATFYHGLDYGFSQDPAFGVRCFIKDDNLYVDYEASKVGLEMDDYDHFFSAKIPTMKTHTVRADNARPESTSYLSRHGFPMIESVKKWKGSVEDGIAFLKSFKKIIIHPRCSELIKEARLYSYKVDRLTGDILPEIVDAHNHGWDALRYALSPLITNNNAGTLDVL